MSTPCRKMSSSLEFTKRARQPVPRLGGDPAALGKIWRYWEHGTGSALRLPVVGMSKMTRIKPQESENLADWTPGAEVVKRILRALGPVGGRKRVALGWSK